MAVISVISSFDNLIMVILSVIVLIRLNKRKGVMHSLLGVVSLGIYPFIWGWVNNKVEKLTVVMSLWSVLLVINFALGVILAMSGASA
jgi:hypothetical protein